jgi:uncharacterized OB-fold protein
MGLTALDFPNTAERPRIDIGSGTLVGSACPACGAMSWPARAVCYACHHAPMEIRTLRTTGTAISYTTVWIPRPGIEPPFVLAQVKITDGPLVFAHLREVGADARVPFPVRLVPAESADAVPPFWFVPDAQQDEAISSTSDERG